MDLKIYKTEVRINEMNIPVIIAQNGISIIFVEYKKTGQAAGLEKSNLRNFLNFCNKKIKKTFKTASNRRYFELDAIINLVVEKDSFFEKYSLKTNVFVDLKEITLSKKSEWIECSRLPEVITCLQENVQVEKDTSESYATLTGVNLHEYNKVKNEFTELNETYLSVKKELQGKNQELQQVTRVKNETVNQLVSVCDNVDRLKEELSQLNISYQTEKGKHEQYKDLYEDLKNSTSTISSTQSDLIDEINDWKLKNGNLEVEIYQLKAKKIDLEKKLKKCKEELSTEKEKTSEYSLSIENGKSELSDNEIAIKERDAKIKRLKELVTTAKSDNVSNGKEKDAEILKLQKKLTAANLLNKSLQDANISIQDENIDLQIGMKQGASPIEKMVTSRNFEMAFIWSLISATFLAAFTKFLVHLLGDAYLITDIMAGLTYAIISLALAFGVVWFSFNKSDSKTVNIVVLGVLFLCEWVSFSKFTGMNTGILLVDVGRDWIFSIFLPTMTLLLAKLQSKKALKIELPDMISMVKKSLTVKKVDNINEIILMLKNEVLKSK